MNILEAMLCYAQVDFETPEDRFCFIAALLENLPAKYCTLYDSDVQINDPDTVRRLGNNEPTLLDTEGAPLPVFTRAAVAAGEVPEADPDQAKRDPRICNSQVLRRLLGGS